MPLPIAAMPKSDKGLTKPQIRILRVLSNTKGALSRSMICELANLTDGILTYIIGRVRKGEANTSRVYTTGKPLMDLGYVVCFVIDVEGKQEKVYQITDAGRQALQNL